MRSYINYIKRQNHTVQDIHATIFATVLTMIIIAVYMQIKFNVFYSEYSDITYINNRDNKADTSTTTTKVGILDGFTNILQTAKVDYIDEIDSSWIDMVPATFKAEETYIREDDK